MVIDEIVESVKKNHIKIVSFDIFDTLIFRTVAEPSDVFLRMYEENTSLFPEYTDGADFVNARKYAEECARQDKYEKNKSREVTLEDIYVCLPTAYEHIERIKQSEIRIEKACAVCNEDIYETLKVLKELKVRVILISDMYLNSSNIKDILQGAGVQTRLIDHIYVSNEWGASKGDGGLFECVIQNEKIRNEELFHVGDNHYGDIGVARRLGIMSYHYDVISSGVYRFPYLLLEEQAYRNPAGSSVRPLRLLSALNGMKDKEALWFEMGAMIVGPFLTYGVEWILDVAEDSGVDSICPIMREGWFIKKMLDYAVAARNGDYSIEPMYISRLSVMKAALDQVTSEIVENLLSTCNMKTRDAFETLGIQDYINEFSLYSDIYLNELSLEVRDGKIIKDEIVAYLCSPDMLAIIRERNKNSSEHIREYLGTLNLVENNAITIDFGWRGSIQYEIDRHLENMGATKLPLHLLFFSKPDAVVNIKRGTVIRGFVGNWGKDEFEILSVFARFLELFFYCEEGTTIGYEKKEGKVKPILKDIPYSEYQKNGMKALQKGILNFQRQFLRIKDKHPEIVHAVSVKREAVAAILRLCSYPTEEEAKMLGKLEYDQNFGASSMLPIISRDAVQALREKGFEKYYGRVKNTGANWCSGINVLYEPAMYLKNILLQNRKYKYLGLALMAEKSLEKAGNRPIILIGAGENGKMMVIIYRLMGHRYPIYILDNNVNLQNSNIGGLEIREINEESVISEAYYVYSTTFINAYKALKKQIGGFIGEYSGISYFEGDF